MVGKRHCGGQCGKAEAWKRPSQVDSGVPSPSLLLSNPRSLFDLKSPFLVPTLQFTTIVAPGGRQKRRSRDRSHAQPFFKASMARTHLLTVEDAEIAFKQVGRFLASSAPGGSSRVARRASAIYPVLSLYLYTGPVDDLPFLRSIIRSIIQF
jgi:hypothetical protein